jgi:hypothetical protein
VADELDRKSQAATFEGWFRLQLMLVAALRARTAAPLAETVLQFTNLHRRFGLGDPYEGHPSPFWEAYVDGLAAASDLDGQVAWTTVTFARAPAEPQRRARYGCFSHELPNADGAVRIHFNSRDSEGGVGPLVSAKRERRIGELAEMFAAVRAAHPEAKTVRGGSWLYNLDAYRRLFPPEYGAARRPPPRVGLNGTSSWGQLIDHTGAVKPDFADAFVRNLEHLDPAAPWLVFPLRALVTSAPIETFYRFYGLG